jgi:hypothetical protein
VRGSEARSHHGTEVRGHLASSAEAAARSGRYRWLADDAGSSAACARSRLAGLVRHMRGARAVGLARRPPPYRPLRAHWRPRARRPRAATPTSSARIATTGPAGRIAAPGGAAADKNGERRPIDLCQGHRGRDGGVGGGLRGRGGSPLARASGDAEPSTDRIALAAWPRRPARGRRRPLARLRRGLDPPACRAREAWARCRRISRLNRLAAFPST